MGLHKGKRDLDDATYGYNFFGHISSKFYLSFICPIYPSLVPLLK